MASVNTYPYLIDTKRFKIKSVSVVVDRLANFDAMRR
jgi:hypothetical protein